MPNYACGLFDLAQQRLSTAVQLDALTLGGSSVLAGALHNYAVLIAKLRGFAAAHEFLASVSAHLPPVLRHFKQLRRTAVGDTVIELGFLAREQGRPDLMRRYMLLGLFRKPAWLRNRGVLSLLARPRSRTA